MTGEVPEGKLNSFYSCKIDIIFNLDVRYFPFDMQLVSLRLQMTACPLKANGKKLSTLTWMKNSNNQEGMVVSDSYGLDKVRRRLCPHLSYARSPH